MALLLHAIAAPESIAHTTGGLRGLALVRVEDGGLVAWATDVSASDEPFGRADLLEHHAVISRIHANTDACLPARFPSWVADVDALRAELQRRSGTLQESLDQVRGRCELALTATWTSPPEEAVPAAPPRSQSQGAKTPGTRFMFERRQALAGSGSRRARAVKLADEIEHLVGDDLIDVRRHVCPSATVALSAALLVPRTSAPELLARLPRAQRDVRILVNGPWPPYTFAILRQAQDE